MAPLEPSDAWTHAVEATYPAAHPTPPAATAERSPCPACGGHLAAGDLTGVDGLTPREAEALRQRRFGALACGTCHALFPWES